MTSPYYAESGPLALDHDGTLYLYPEDESDRVKLGHIESEPTVPGDCEADLAELVSQWADRASDNTEELLWSFHGGLMSV